MSLVYLHNSGAQNDVTEGSKFRYSLFLVVLAFKKEVELYGVYSRE